MSNFFRQKYGGSAGHILDTWASNKIVQEIGEIYEQHVFGQKSFDLAQILNEYHGGKTGGQIVYNEDLNNARKNGNVITEKSDN